ncbi:hypothetical protein MBSD_n1126 [Mizugakiibacter sediminis]|uniref:Teneurin-like YD-shell domain-containing protein n=1 Tax=Mizugakiibacter sediminis TaxID=1475481 RepID=A0A0K8QLM1_9GAMM|nr:RHS repeat-associated core domain-containing protein [Mizugakiibacter sediminis]GAP65835.1 hypothetical protein MBSD_n1126 [Mizugakiibacter sediminis]
MRTGTVFALLLFATSSAHAETVVYYHTDALGSPVAVTDANGNVIERTRYAPYGDTLNRPLHDGPGYIGHETDAPTGLVYMQQRYYDPILGRFLSADPVAVDAGKGTSFNRYWYTRDNPYRFNDPDGRLETPFWDRNLSERLTSYVAQEMKSIAIDAIAKSLHVAEKRVANSVAEKRGALHREVKDRTSVAAKGVAAYGGGGVVQKGIYNANDKISIVTPAFGLEAKTDVSFRIATIDFVDHPVDSSVHMETEISGHFIGGGSINIDYNPGGSVSVSVGGGVGLGASFANYAVALDVNKTEQ